MSGATRRIGWDGRGRPPLHTIGDPPPVHVSLPYNDVRDDLVALPHAGNDGYAVLDLFTVRAEVIRRLDTPPASVFEFGAYRGYFLVTALHAAPSIRRVGWIDNELNLPNSNMLCSENVLAYANKAGLPIELPWFRTVTRECIDFGQADLVQVDAAHSYIDCLTDLLWAEQLDPKTIMVDDYLASTCPGVPVATHEFAEWRGWDVDVHETVNGLAVLTRRDDVAGDG